MWQLQWPPKLNHVAYKHCPFRICHMAFKHWPLGYATWTQPKQRKLNLKLDIYSKGTYVYEPTT
jgi:hypothetical protein